MVAPSPPRDSNDVMKGQSGANHDFPSNKFVKPGIVLFLDQLLVAVGGWIYWLVISKFVLTSEIGHATTIYSLVLLVSIVVQLGLEYPLLKKSVEHRRQILGTVMMIELVLTLISIAIIFFASNNLYQESSELAWVAIGILTLSTMGFVSRFALLGLSASRTILLFDLVGTAVKFGSALVLVSAGFGAIGILLSFLFQAAVITCGTIFVAGKTFGLGFGNVSFFREVLRDGVVNLPSKLSGILVVSLSVVLLASFGVPASEVGIFYIALMISIVVGSFASSLAFMSIPASSASNKDLSVGSLRIGLGFTAPIIAALIVAPTSVLSIIGPEYAQAGSILLVLAMGVLPSVIISNAMSKFNNQNKPRQLLVIGSIRLGVFIVGFYILVPQLGTLGAAYAILVSFTASAILSMVWSEKASFRFIGIAVLSIIAGVLAGQAANILAQNLSVAAIAISISASLAIMFAFKCVSIREISTILGAIRNV